MRGPLTLEDLEERADLANGFDPHVHRDAAADFQVWASESHPDDDAEVTRGQLLVFAGEQLAMAGDREAALGLLREAVASGDATFPDARAYLVHALLDCGLTDEADKVAETLRRERHTDPRVHERVGQAYREAKRPDAALRWFTMGLVRAVRDGDFLVAPILMVERYEVRQAMGFPPDDYDALAEEALELAEDELDDELDELDDELGDN
jgi:hypothetical protein